MNGFYKIMLIDGSETSRKMIAQLLQRSVQTADIRDFDSMQAALLQLQLEHFDLICTALILPDGDGLEFARQIRQLEGGGYAKTPVIIVSGNADSRLRDDASSMGVTGYFDKSKGLKHLVEYLRSHLSEDPHSPGNILYVEDGEPEAPIVHRALKSYGFRMTQTLSAEDALEFIRRSPPDAPGGYDLILTDFHLKGLMNGQEFIRKIRRHRGYLLHELPAVLMTIEGEQQNYSHIIENGANDFVVKPVIEKVLIARVQAWITLKRQYFLLNPRHLNSGVMVQAADSVRNSFSN